jgi:hypothetical protein
MNLYNLYKFHKGEFDEDITEYKGYRIEIHYDHSKNEYSADAFDLIAQEYVFYPCIFMKNSTIANIIEASITNIDKKIELNNRNDNILIYTDNETKN